MSSYSVSLTSLIYARRNTIWRGQPSELDNALLVIQDKTPGLNYLPGALTEGRVVVESLSKASKTMSTRLMSNPTKAEVLGALSWCQIFHKLR
jgi:hypothetical protein